MLNAGLLTLAIVLNVMAQVALKLAVRPLGPLAPMEMIAHVPRLMLGWALPLGLLLYAASVVNWLAVLSRIDLSVAYPIMSGGYVLTLVLGAWWFHEPINGMRIAGVLVILLGIALITRPVATASPTAHEAPVVLPP